MITRNPLVSTAVTPDDIVCDMPFKSYIPLSEDSDSQRIGIFRSYPYTTEREERVVNIEMNGECSTVELCTLGITPNSDGEWNGYVTIIEDLEE